MARKNQKLINYHTSSKTAMPSGSSVDFGEIVVRHNAETPELLIKIGEDSFGVFQASGAVQTAINTAVSAAQSTLNTTISGLQSDVKSLSSATKTLIDEVSAATKATYATKAELKSTSGSIITAYEKAVGDAKIEIYDSATTFATKAKDDAITAAAASATTLLGLVDAVDERVDTVSGDLNTFKTDVADTYETKDNVSTAITAAKDSVYLSATTAAAADAKTKADTAYSSATTAAAASAETLNNSIEAVDGKVGTLSGNVHTRIEGLKTDLTDTINEKVATAYRFQGSCTYAELASKEKVNGYVWNVTDAHDNVPAGTNYAWSEEENKWDALGGIVDLSPYATTTYVDSAITKVNQTNTNLKSDIDSLSSATKTLIDEVSAATKATYATKDELKSTSGSIITAYTNAIAAAKKEATDASSAYTDTQVKAAKDSIKQTTDAISRDLSNLSASTVSIETTANSAIQTASIVDGDTCKVSVKKEKTELQFDFSNLVIDCGDF